MVETPEQRFIRVAGRRVKTVLKELELLANCSNKHNYHYTPVQVASMRSAIEAAVQECVSKFSVQRSKTFNF